MRIWSLGVGIGCMERVTGAIGSTVLVLGGGGGGPGDQDGGFQQSWEGGGGVSQPQYCDLYWIS